MRCTQRMRTWNSPAIVSTPHILVILRAALSLTPSCKAPSKSLASSVRTGPPAGKSAAFAPARSSQTGPSSARAPKRASFIPCFLFCFLSGWQGATSAGRPASRARTVGGCGGGGARQGAPSALKRQQGPLGHPSRCRLGPFSTSCAKDDASSNRGRGGAGGGGGGGISSRVTCRVRLGVKEGGGEVAKSQSRIARPPGPFLARRHLSPRRLCAKRGMERVQDMGVSCNDTINALAGSSCSCPKQLHAGQLCRSLRPRLHSPEQQQQHGSREDAPRWNEENFEFSSIGLLRTQREQKGRFKGKKAG